MDVWVRSAQQHQEERSISFISGSGSAAFRALHNDLPLSCTNAPSPCTATLFQQYFKDRQLVRHAIFHLVSSNVSFDLLAGSEVTRDLRQTNNGGILALVPNKELFEKTI
jgi:hypothetical protein